MTEGPVAAKLVTPHRLRALGLVHPFGQGGSVTSALVRPPGHGVAGRPSTPVVSPPRRQERETDEEADRDHDPLGPCRHALSLGIGALGSLHARQ